MKSILITMCVAFAMLFTTVLLSASELPSPAGYIVVLHDSVDSPAAAAREMVLQAGGKVGFIYEHALKGFSITIPLQAIDAIKRNPMVKYVATNDIRFASAQTIPTGVERIFADTNTNIDIDSTDDSRVDVDVAVIDTGIDFEHPDLNVEAGVDCTVSSGGGPPWARTLYCSADEGTGGDDDHYHGTHVAGTIGAIDNGFGVVGVAPGARLWAVKVLDSAGSGYSSGIIAGIDWIASKADTIEVANMSLGGSDYNQAEYDAIQGAVNKGVAFAVAAGNDNDNAANYSPAAFDNVLTVSALADFDGEPGGLGSPTCRTDQDDTLADFSNWGAAVDIAAPGVCILSTYPIEQGEYGTISGTSMASPHVAGALALLASGENNNRDATYVYGLYNQIKTTGNYDWDDYDDPDDFKEPLLDVSTVVPVLIASGGETPPVNTEPNVIIDSPEDGMTFKSGNTISFLGTASDNEDINLDGDDLVWVSSIEGKIGAGASFSTALSDDEHIITASVTDSGNLTGSDSITITVTADIGGGITLSVSAFKVRGAGVAELTWEWADSLYSYPPVDIYRGDSMIATEISDRTYTDNDLGQGGGSATYKVCEEETTTTTTTTCSNSVTVSW